MNSDDPTVRGHASLYARMHMADWVPRHYDEVVYAEDSHDSFLWSLERPVLRRIAEGVCPPDLPLRYLDFACGTGRILSALEDLADDALGVDTSAEMLSAARGRVRTAQLRQGDLLADPPIAPGPYDLVTAFRFFLNTEPDVRVRVIAALAARLRGEKSRLVFNLHQSSPGNLGSTAWRRLRRRSALHPSTFWDARDLVRGAGLEIADWHGFGVLPDCVSKSPLRELARAVDRRLAGRTPARWISRDLVFSCKLRTGPVARIPCEPMDEER